MDPLHSAIAKKCAISISQFLRIFNFSIKVHKEKLFNHHPIDYVGNIVIFKSVLISFIANIILNETLYLLIFSVIEWRTSDTTNMVLGTNVGEQMTCNRMQGKRH